MDIPHLDLAALPEVKYPSDEETVDMTPFKLDDYSPLLRSYVDAMWKCEVVLPNTQAKLICTECGDAWPFRLFTYHGMNDQPWSVCAPCQVKQFIGCSCPPGWQMEWFPGQKVYQCRSCKLGCHGCASDAFDAYATEKEMEADKRAEMSEMSQ